MPRLSPSACADLVCNHRFWTLNVLRQNPPREAVPFATFSLAFHELAAKVFNPRLGTPPNLTHLDAWSRQAFSSHNYPLEDGREEDRARCLRMIHGYVSNDDPEDVAGTLAVEHWVEHPITRNGKLFFLLSGRLDRILTRANRSGVIIIGRDYKLGRPKTNLQSAFVNLWLLKVAFPGYADYQFELDWIAEGGRVDREVITVADIKGQHAILIEQMEHILLSEDHPQEPGEGCQWCRLASICPSRTNEGSDCQVDVFA